MSAPSEPAIASGDAASGELPILRAYPTTPVANRAPAYPIPAFRQFLPASPGLSPSLPTAPSAPIGEDRVHFTVTTASILVPDRIVEIYLWAHTAEQRPEVIDRFGEIAKGPTLSRSQGPARIERGTMVRVRLAIDGLDVPEPEEMLLWNGEISSAIFLLPVPAATPSGQRGATVRIFILGLRVAALKFIVEVGQATVPNSVTAAIVPYRKAFASYAQVDRDQVLGRVQGMQKVLPELDIFLDVVSLRFSKDWASKLWKVIPECDIFYLFWSANAKKSAWVTQEWRCGLKTRGLSFIDPVPLESPDVAPPPPELADKHFNDWCVHTPLGRARRAASRAIGEFDISTIQGSGPHRPEFVRETRNDARTRSRHHRTGRH